MIRILLMVLLASPVFAAPKIDSLSVKADAKSPEVEVSVAVTRSGGSCDVRVDFGTAKGEPSTSGWRRSEP